MGRASGQYPVTLSHDHQKIVASVVVTTEIVEALEAGQEFDLASEFQRREDGSLKLMAFTLVPKLALPTPTEGE